MDLETERKRLERASDYIIEFTEHAKHRLSVRQLSRGEVEDNLKDPRKLSFVRSDKQDKTKREYYFRLSNTLTHKYVVQFDESNKKLKVITVVKIRNKWQRLIDRWLK